MFTLKETIFQWRKACISILKKLWLVIVFMCSTYMSVIGYNDHRFTLNHRRICWVCEHYAETALFKNLLNSAQILVGNGRF